MVRGGPVEGIVPEVGNGKERDVRDIRVLGIQDDDTVTLFPGKPQGYRPHWKRGETGTLSSGEGRSFEVVARELFPPRGDFRGSPVSRHIENSYPVSIRLNYLNFLSRRLSFGRTACSDQPRKY